MILYIKDVLKMLEHLQPELLISKVESIEVEGVEIFRPFVKKFSENTIYLMNSEDLEYINEMENVPAAIICTDAASTRQAELARSAGSVVFMAALNKKDVLFTEIFSALHTVCAGEGAAREKFKDKLIDALYEGKSFKKILDISSQHFGNPVKLYNMAGYVTMISSYRQEWIGDSEDSETWSNMLKNENISSDELDKFIGISSSFYQPEVHGGKKNQKKIYGNARRRVINYAGEAYTTVKVRNIVTGVATVSGIYRPVEPYDIEDLNYVAKILSMKMQQDTDNDMKGSSEAFLRRLINADRDNNSTLRMQHIMLEKTFGRNGMRAMIIRSSTNRNLYTNRGVVKQIMRLFFKNCIILFYDDDILMLLNEVDYEEAMKPSFEVFLRKNRMTAGISSLFRKFDELQDMYVQADRAVSIGAEMNKKRNVRLYDELYIYDIIKIYSRENRLKNICHNAVRQLAESGKESDRELLRTMYVYLLCCGDTGKASEMLNIHRNTMYYRLEQIKKITGAQIDDGRQRFQMMLSFYSMRAIAESLSLIHI